MQECRSRFHCARSHHDHSVHLQIHGMAFWPPHGQNCFFFPSTSPTKRCFIGAVYNGAGPIPKRGLQNQGFGSILSVSSRKNCKNTEFTNIWVRATKIYRIQVFGIGPVTTSSDCTNIPNIHAYHFFLPRFSPKSSCKSQVTNALDFPILAPDSLHTSPVFPWSFLQYEWINGGTATPNRVCWWFVLSQGEYPTILLDLFSDWECADSTRSKLGHQLCALRCR